MNDTSPALNDRNVPVLDEARQAWKRACRRSRDPLRSWVAAVCLAVPVGALFAIGSAAPRGLSVSLAVGAMLLLAGAVFWRWRRTTGAPVARTERCPRCGASAEVHVLEAEDGCIRCAQCSGRLYRAGGLLIAATHDVPLRRRRWAAAAERAAACRTASRAPGTTSEPAAWLLWGVAVFVTALVTTDAFVTPLTQPEMHSSLADRTLGASDGVARARLGSPLAVLTRARAAPWLGTQVLAPRGQEPELRLAVVMEVSDRGAQLVFADGESGVVPTQELRVPEIAPQDEVEVLDGGRWRRVRLERRRGPAVLASGRWTSVARVRIRPGAPHRAGMGRDGSVHPHDWVEVQVTPGQWAPGVVVERTGGVRRVVLAEGALVLADEEDLRPQTLGPGARVRLDDGRPRVVAARVGHALVLVDSMGRRAWSAISRVSRR